MKIAIMGAGLSGLACGITLEKNGIEDFTIFESRIEVDDRFVNGEIFLSALNAPIEDCISYLSEEFGIYLQPVGDIKKLIIISENETATINGTLGFNVARGRRGDSISKQMEAQLHSKIVFNSKYTYEDLKKEYTHIILATGDASYSEKMGNYNRDFTVSLKGGIVKGSFDRNVTMAWLNNNFAPKGYSYLIPLSETEANIVIAYPDLEENTYLDFDVLWNRFFEAVQIDLKEKIELVDSFEITKYIIGHCKKPRIGNTFFAGNCYGSIMPFLGFGQFTAIMTGIYAAHDLCGKGQYEKLISTFDESYENSLVLRRAMEKLDNNNFDFLVKHLNGHIGNIVLDFNNINSLKIASNLLKPIELFSNRES